MTKAERKQLQQSTKLKTLRKVLNQVDNVISDKIHIDQLQDELICDIVELENLIDKSIVIRK